MRWHGEYTTFTDLYENRSDAAIEAREPHFETHFSGVDEQPLEENDDLYAYGAADLTPPPEKKGKKQAKKNPEEDFSDPFAPLVRPLKDEDII